MKKITMAMLVASLAACASVQPARMKLPSSLAVGAEAHTINGIGPGRTGQFQVDGATGGFSRSASRLAFFDTLYERRDGRAAFDLSVPGSGQTLQASCRMRERSVTLGIISIEPHPMAYGCDFSEGGKAMAAHFELQAFRQGLGGAMMRQERRGEILLDGVALQIRSVHDLEGSSFQMGTPIGYVFDRDGVPVGAVEINGAPMVTYGPQVDPATRRAITVASLALGLFWDPAESALGREAG